MEKIKGLCVSKGTTEGKIYILNKKNKQKSLHFDTPTILVMKKLEREIIIDLDKNIVGVIAEAGNIGSHGAGILRQLKIPCILRIPNATEILIENSFVKIIGEENRIVCEHINSCEKKNNVDSFNELSYAIVTKSSFGIQDIKAVNEWTCPRPDRIYQELRYDIMHDVFACSGEFLFGLPAAKVSRNKKGAIITYGNPNIADVCSFYLCNPSWVIEKAKQRTKEFSSIKDKLMDLVSCIDNNENCNYLYVFDICVELYRSIFKYAYISQAVSDEIIDIYLDFLYTITKKSISKDVLNLSSNYVENCLDGGIDPGVSQTWNSRKAFPHIWDGHIEYSSIPKENYIVDAIMGKENSSKLLQDYDSFRTIVPLIYQLSEEFFYISSSINSFINWSIISVSNLSRKDGDKYFRPEDFYSMNLSSFREHVNKLV